MILMIVSGTDINLNQLDDTCYVCETNDATNPNKNRGESLSQKLYVIYLAGMHVVWFIASGV